MILNERQKQIIAAQESKIVVEACPACGKTAVLIERIRFLVDSGVTPEGIVAITFTNTAANEIKERLGEKANGVFIGTIHGYANFLLYSNDINTLPILKLKDFDKLFDLVEQNPDCVPTIDHLLLDEAQDSTKNQYHFLFNVLHPRNFFLVGDPRQAIFVWADADPEFFLNLMDSPEVTTYHLNQNYRNARNIASFAKSLILLAGYRYQDNSTPMREEKGRVINATASISSICRALRDDNDYKNWFVLCRTNQELNIMLREFEMRDIPFDVIKRSELPKEEMLRILQKDSIKLMTIHAAKGLESQKVMVIGAKFYNIEEICTSYVAATRARDLLVWVQNPKRGRKKVQSWE